MSEGRTPTVQGNGGGEPSRPAPALQPAGARRPPPPLLPSEVESAIAAFLRGVAEHVAFDASVVERWRQRVAREIEQIDWSSARATPRALSALESLKSEVMATVVAPRRYAALLRLWSLTLVGMIGVALVLGESGLVSGCRSVPLLGGLVCNPLHGHFLSYIAFRYLAYGVLIGSAIRLSYDRSRATFDGGSSESNLLNRPVLNVLLGSTIAYLLAALVVSGQLKLAVLGLAIQRSFIGKEPVFRNAGALLAIGLVSGIAADAFVRRLMDGARRSASDFLAPPKKA